MSCHLVFSVYVLTHFYRGKVKDAKGMYGQNKWIQESLHFNGGNFPPKIQNSIEKPR